jgi:hypothetical protein
MPYTLSRFSFTEMMDCRARIRALLKGDFPSYAAGAERIVDFFHEELRDDEGQRAFANVRFFMTRPFGELGPDLQQIAGASMPEGIERDGVRCLTLLATRGIDPLMNRAIPLHSVAMVEQTPMIAQIVQGIGLSIEDVVHPEPRIPIKRQAESYSVLHVPDAAGNPPGVASILGFGGLLASGDMFAVVMSSRVPISSEVAAHFKILGLNMKIAVLTLVGKPLFE